ncbi:histone-lysine N-methyltransferase SETMAR [Plakobranchus ocellatus]|uniref:Histone-lysine N-methyltransferase SETMAR n=1 Tax=Plakobranchus ocellatus TaxID=259542 RepID=A0AAV4AV95_9GAST|nr:histone-lysine N-methyltransferase SETMAR [Plakobranchus ocellatus]
METEGGGGRGAGGNPGRWVDTEGGGREGHECSWVRTQVDAEDMDSGGILHDNATLHSANLTQQWLQRYGWEILPHPAHSPDLAPSDFHLFGPLKRHLGGMAFETEDGLISELRNWFDNLDVDFFRTLGPKETPSWLSLWPCGAGLPMSADVRHQCRMDNSFMG